jgi:uncharacterized protein YegJ (DUF2314 family)
MPLLLLCAVLLFSCQKSSDLSVAGEPSRIIKEGQNNEEILQITEDARNTLPGFFRQLTRGAAEHFCVKYPFITDEDSGVNTEQLWLTGIYFKNGVYYGILANTPRHLGGLKKGDKVTFNMDEITDWMYVRGGKIIGGDSIKYLLERIPDYQRSEGERELLRMFN